MEQSISNGEPRRPTILAAASVNAEFSWRDEGVLPSALRDRKVLGTVRMIGPNLFSVDSPDFSGRIDMWQGAERFDAGSSMNVLHTLRQLGCDEPIAVVAPMKDPMTCGVAAFLEERIQGLNGDLFRVPADNTRLTLAIRHANGDSTRLCGRTKYHDAEVDFPSWLRPSESQQEVTSNAVRPMLALTGTKPEDLDLAERLIAETEAGARVAFMPSKALLRRTDLHERMRAIVSSALVVQVNTSEAETFMGDNRSLWTSLELAERIGANMLLLTAEDQGAELVDTGTRQTVIQAAPKVTAVDKCGAGDTHFATFLYFHYIAGYPKNIALALAVKVASATVAHVGPCRGIPSMDTLLADIPEVEMAC